jgi:catechol 2,3-dioxygenase-like lactoylglutathione lyase family enzyme
MTPVCKLSRFGLTTAHADRLAIFYEQAFGCRRIATESLSGPDFEQLMGVGGGARRLTLVLGDEVIELLEFARSGEPYPRHSQTSDLIFQHFAIVVSDMAEAWARLSQISGWSAITRGGPQCLPASSGGVTAFKFRDPDGHPLEFLAFPPAHTPPKWQRGPDAPVCLGIDHSAISVSDTSASCAFYESLGLRSTARTLNTGTQQGFLDAIPEARVAVTALSPRQTAPHLELLCYQTDTNRQPMICKSNAIAATRLVFEYCPTQAPVVSRTILDPDGHHLTLRPPGHSQRPA